MRKLIFILLVGMIYSPVYSQDYLDQYLKLAAENNPGLKAKFNDYLAAMERINQAKGLPDPQVAFGYFLQSVETRVGPQRATVAINQSFPWFGTLKAQGDVAATNASSKLVAFENARLMLFRDVKLHYNQLYFLHQSIQLTEENIELLRSFKELARVNFESGKTGFVNVLRVEMEEEELHTQLQFLKDSKSAARAEFENLLNTRLSDEIEFPDQLEIIQLKEDKKVLYDSIINQNLRLQELQLMADSKEKQVEAAKLMGKPSLTIGASYINIAERTDMDMPGNGQDAFLFPQVGVRVPIFRKKYQAMQEQAKLEQQSLEYQISDESNSLSSQLERLITSHLDAQRRIRLNEKLHDLAERSLSLLQTEFTTGVTGFEEVIRMERKLLTYQLALQKAIVDNNNAIYKINYLLGK